MSRTSQQQFDAILEAIRQGNEFRARAAAADDILQCADLMAEAIAMHRAARGLETVGRDNRLHVTFEELRAMYCLDAARAAYLAIREPPP
jgi:hypothetical protein